jgi:ABC-type glycerol-3-phosphate transport system substrate-binding protein
MKKLLFVLAIGAFAACGSGSGSGSAADSTAAKDSTTMMAPTPDTSVHPADTTKVDSTKK